MKIKDANELYSLTDKWVNEFNFIQLAVLEKMSDNCLFEFIEQSDVDFDEFLNNYMLWDEYKEYLSDNEEEENEETKTEFCEDHHSFDDWRSDRENENYPMWNTCFEFKHSISEEIKQAAKDAGFGIIEGLDDFNTILFATGCGYSFYGAHWIPMFINLPWNSDIKQQVIDEKMTFGHF